MSFAIIALLAAFITREITHHNQDKRRDALISELTDKVKAKNFTEYKEMTMETKIYEPVERSDSDLWEMELEEQKR